VAYAIRDVDHQIERESVAVSAESSAVRCDLEYALAWHHVAADYLAPARWNQFQAVFDSANEGDGVDLNFGLIADTLQMECFAHAKRKMEEAGESVSNEDAWHRLQEDDPRIPRLVKLSDGLYESFVASGVSDKRPSDTDLQQLTAISMAAREDFRIVQNTSLSAARSDSALLRR